MAAQPQVPVPDPVADAATSLRLAGFRGTLSDSATFAQLTTYRLGGPLALLAEPAAVADFTLLHDWLQQTGLPHIFLGGGTNILASSHPFAGLVIRLGAPLGQLQQPAPDRLVIGGAASTAAVLKYCQQTSLGGLEVLSGVPGTLGGAVAMNAGTMKDWIERAILSVTALAPDWSVRTLPPADCGFRYRGSRLLDEGWRVLETTFAVTPGVDIREHVTRHLAMRRQTQPGGRNAGSNFKNPPGASAGALIDQAGCKGWREGGAVVSSLHANFILAEVGCTPEDVLRLMQRVARQVEAYAGIRLEPEVVLLNFPTPWEATWDSAAGGAS